MPLIFKIQHQNVLRAWLFYFFAAFASAMSPKNSMAQIPVPYGISLDSVYIDNLFSVWNYQSFHLYKPTTYDPLTSPILFAMHGDGGNGTSAIGSLDSIAIRRKALIIAPNFFGNGGDFTTIMRHQEPVLFFPDTTDFCALFRPASLAIRKIYEHILLRENRISVPCYMIGFSAGAQFVTRYMLIRQAYPDSIPLKMAVSSNAYFYTFPTDNFMGVAMPWLCGLIMPTDSVWYCPQTYTNMYSWTCNEQVIQYYNENYGVLIGTGDTQPLSGNSCSMAQGSNRYERALNFYNFCDSNATNRGTTLQWPYVEIPGIGHDQYGMYNVKASPTDSFSIAETLLFDTPYHNVLFTSPVASFYADTTKIYINGTVNFTNTSINATSYLWDFGDGSTSTLTNPSHTYTVVDTFRVQLTAFNGTGCWNWTEKRHYIKVVIPVSISTIQFEGGQIKIYPNPFHDKIKINHTSLNGHLIIRNLIGEMVFEKEFSSFKNEEELSLSF
ncbi:MAG TPA: PKD domain-containing protein, partial [Bacteroidia bacterium]|nr:PKD domain-containing protein [Bacteroidia bacterium]